MVIELDPQTTYLVECKSDSTVLLALQARVHLGRVEWFDTVRDRSIHFDEIGADGGTAVVQTKEGVYRFTPLTLELYRDRVRERVDGRPDFESTDAVQRYYRRFPT